MRTPRSVISCCRWVSPTLALAAASLAAAADEPVTFTKQVAPILFQKCAPCHHPGEVAPFSLLTYKDAAKRAGFIKEVTASRRMPVWKAAPGYGEFLDDRSLSDAQIKTLARWAEAGAPEGDPKDLPPAPQFTDEWKLGTPDLILKVPAPFTIPADGREIFRWFVLPTGVNETRAVAAVEFKPGNRRVVHHALFYLDNTGASRKKAENDPSSSFSNAAAAFGFRPTGFLGGWAPGATPTFLPEGIGRMFPEGSDVMIQIHYHPTGKEEKDQSSLGIYFTKKPARRMVVLAALGERRLEIPPGEKRYRVNVRYTLPVDVQVISMGPHMHNLGREMKVTAQPPGGKEQVLIWIKDWDFNWQGFYQYAKPVPLPKGTVLEMEAFFDNSEENPKNPNHPPKLVRIGPFTTNEMCLCGLTFVTDQPEDRRQLLQDLNRFGRERQKLFMEWQRDHPRPLPGGGGAAPKANLDLP